MARKINHEFRVGDRVAAPDGYFPDGKSRPWRIGVVEELYGPNDWPRVAFSGSVDLETCTPAALKRVCVSCGKKPRVVGTECVDCLAWRARMNAKLVGELHERAAPNCGERINARLAAIREQYPTPSRAVEERMERRDRN